MDIRLKRSPGLYLTGFMGSGKSSVGSVLAEHLGWEFVDLDAEIEAAEHATVAEIFEQRGEPEFRRIENQTVKTLVRRIERGMPCVVALGGGTFVQPENACMIENHGISIWLDCSFETIERRLPDKATRPLARDSEAFRQLYEARRDPYSRANYRVNAECDVESAVEFILSLPFWK